MIYRKISEKLKNAIAGEKKVFILYGPRQAGKTTLIKSLANELNWNYEYYSGDDLRAQDIFSRNELEILKKNISKEYLIIDEAQRIENIGLTMKLIFDNLPVKIFATGSASFDLANKINEPLTGRTKIFWLYPLAYSEVSEKYTKLSNRDSLEEMLKFGMYPKIHTLTSDRDKEDYLYDYLNNYLHKDILMFENIRKPKKIVDLLTLLALQIGNEVSVAELAQNLALSQKTVESYLDVLEKMFVLVNLRGFSRNLRKEISKTSKYYFFDVGLRNALIRNFNPLNIRNDAGALFENWFVVEKIKAADIFDQRANFYFWRTYDQQEIDLIEERGGNLFGYEVKWNKKDIKQPTEWLSTYKNSSFKVVNSDNFADFLSDFKSIE